MQAPISHAIRNIQCQEPHFLMLYTTIGGISQSQESNKTSGGGKLLQGYKAKQRSRARQRLSINWAKDRNLWKWECNEGVRTCKLHFCKAAIKQGVRRPRESVYVNRFVSRSLALTSRQIHQLINWEQLQFTFRPPGGVPWTMMAASTFLVECRVMRK